VLVEFTSAYDGLPVAVEAELIGQVKALMPGRLGRTLLIHRQNRRVHWQVNEEYTVVMGRLVSAGRVTFGGKVECKTCAP